MEVEVGAIAATYLLQKFHAFSVIPEFWVRRKELLGVENAATLAATFFDHVLNGTRIHVVSHAVDAAFGFLDMSGVTAEVIDEAFTALRLLDVVGSLKVIFLLDFVVWHESEAVDFVNVAVLASDVYIIFDVYETLLAHLPGMRQVTQHGSRQKVCRRVEQTVDLVLVREAPVHGANAARDHREEQE